MKPWQWRGVVLHVERHEWQGWFSAGSWTDFLDVLIPASAVVDLEGRPAVLATNADGWPPYYRGGASRGAAMMLPNATGRPYLPSNELIEQKADDEVELQKAQHIMSDRVDGHRLGVLVAVDMHHESLQSIVLRPHEHLGPVRTVGAAALTRIDDVALFIDEAKLTT